MPASRSHPRRMSADWGKSSSPVRAAGHPSPSSARRRRTSRRRLCALRVSELRKDASEASREFRLAAAVAAYGQLLRGGAYTGGFGYPDAIALAETTRGVDPESGDFLQLLMLADGLSTRDAQARLSP